MKRIVTFELEQEDKDKVDARMVDILVSLDTRAKCTNRINRINAKLDGDIPPRKKAVLEYRKEKIVEKRESL